MKSYRSVKSLLKNLKLKGGKTLSNSDFPFLVPKEFADRIKTKSPNDPLLLQVFPHSSENNTVEGYGKDPLKEADFVKKSPLLKKYAGRALLMPTAACAIHCRYCFRRHFPYAKTASARELNVALDAIRSDKSINEVILSGGDPLMLSNRKLLKYLSAIDCVPHVKRLRIHSRIPIVTPSRIDEGFLKVLSKIEKPIVLVVHANHPYEIDKSVTSALANLKKTGIILLNQSVLLKDINDDEETLKNLSEKLFSAGVLPYYLHLLDRVDGSAHFEVTDQKARTIENALRKVLPGYLMPKFVREIPGMHSKTPLE
jgi:EF-P beta-lysylation protein EpmB